jgi:hypothetical protein
MAAVGGIEVGVGVAGGLHAAKKAAAIRRTSKTGIRRFDIRDFSFELYFDIEGAS